MEKLYKFHAVDENSIDALRNGKIWASRPADFNDPFDCPATNTTLAAETRVHVSPQEFLGVDGDHLPGGVPRYPKLQYFRARGLGWKPFEVRNIKRELNEAELQRIGEMGIYCLSTDSTNMLLWSHYADNHRGFAIEYGAEPGTLLADPVHRIEVQYVDQVPEEDVDDETLLRSVAKHKATIWSYEQEVRVIYDRGGRLYDAPAPVSALIFGARMPSADRDKLVAAVEGRQIALYSIALLPRSFQLEVVPAD